MAIDKIQSESINLADNFAFTGTVTGAGGVNTPAFHASLTSVQTISDATWTKIAINSEKFDVGSVYDASTNYRYTPGYIGKSFIYGNSVNNSNNDSGLVDNYLAIYKNGTIECYARNYHPNGTRVQGYHISAIISHDADDYFELYAHIDILAGTPRVQGSGTDETFFGAYKIIE
tara:strand:- start:42 stop:563 length:522 start_codon:yes stop_codon:yes gene_type:complete